VSKAGAVVYVIGGQDLPRELVEQVIFLVSAFSRGQECNRVPIVGSLDVGQLVSYDVQCGVPIGLNKCLGGNSVIVGGSLVVLW